MKKTSGALNPCIYLDKYMSDYEDYFREHADNHKKLEKGSYLTQYGVINNTAYYIKSGIMHLSLGHDDGIKGLAFFGPGTIFPVGVEEHKVRGEYEMILRAMTDLEVYSVSYPGLKKMVQENGRFAGELFSENCDFIGYLFFDTINSTFESGLKRICDVLYLYLDKISPDQNRILLTQEELSELTGVSVAQTERSIRFLRNENIIQTGRRQIIVKDQNALLHHCSDGMKML